MIQKICKQIDADWGYPSGSHKFTREPVYNGKLKCMTVFTCSIQAPGLICESIFECNFIET